MPCYCSCMGTVLNQVVTAVVLYYFSLNLVVVLDYQLSLKIELDVKGGNVKLCGHGFQSCILNWV